jgi:hypothetical protein
MERRHPDGKIAKQSQSGEPEIEIAFSLNAF